MLSGVRRAVRLVGVHARSRPDAHVLRTSYRRGDGSPEDFYRRLGFEPTGEEEDGEILARLELS